MRRYCAGFSLVELMIAITLGLVLMAGVLQMFLGSRVTYSTQQATAHIQETGRLALEFMSRDIRMAGYIGCASRSIPQVDSTLKGNAFFHSMLATNPAGALGVSAIRGYSASSAPAAAGLNPSPSANTDILVITRAAGEDVAVSKNKEDAAFFARLDRVEARACTGNKDRLSGLCDGDIVVVTDCQKARVFQATSVANVSGEVKITHAATGSPGNNPATWGGASDAANGYGDGTQILKLDRTVYYIAPGRSGRPSLWQNTNGTSMEILEDVARMVLLYGLDTNADGIPDSYQSAAAIEAGGTSRWFNVLSVRVQLLVQSQEDNVAPQKQIYSFAGQNNIEADDLRVRQVFISTIGIRSRID